MKTQRPKNLNLFTIRFPMPAIVSILHRISGFILALVIPFILWGLYLSLNSQESFDTVHQFFVTPWVKFFLWCFLSAFLFHFVAGIRHLLMDAHVGDELKSGRLGSIITFIVSAILIVLLGIWLW